MPLLINSKWSLPFLKLKSISCLIQSCEALQYTNSLSIDALSDDVFRIFKRYLDDPRGVSPIDMIYVIKALDFFHCPAELDTVCRALSTYLENAQDDELENIHSLIQRIW